MFKRGLAERSREYPLETGDARRTNSLVQPDGIPLPKSWRAGNTLELVACDKGRARIDLAALHRTASANDHISGFAPYVAACGAGQTQPE